MVIEMKHNVIERNNIPQHKLIKFCHRWSIVELGLFGSSVRDDFSQESDFDVLVSFAPGSSWSVFDLVVMQDELAKLLGRKVDLVEREALQNPFRRREILRNLEIVYAA